MRNTMRMKWIWGMTAVLVVAAGCTGCSRATLNYQIAESIGTVGMYENDEPVETPRMKAEREQREAIAQEEDAFARQLAQAEELAAGYQYEEAIAYLERLEKTDLAAERIDQTIQEYQQAYDSMVPWSGEYAHLCFPVLIEDTLRAFDGDDRSSIYAGSMVTTKEFKAILEDLYAKGYVLINIDDIAAITTDARGVSMMDAKTLRLPSDRRPIILSQDNLSYSDVTNGDGIATRLALDENGEVKAVYTDSEGHDLKGDYDFIPILNSFIEEHPDFSYRGARGIVSVSASEGIFGYDVAEGALMTNNESRETVQAIAQKLVSDGWKIACAGYTHSYMNDMTYDQLVNDITKWQQEAGSLVGTTNILFYPYGGEVKYPSEALDYLLKNGLTYLCGLWADSNFLELGEGYMRQTRRFVDGYTLENAPSYFMEYFDAAGIKDTDR